MTDIKNTLLAALTIHNGVVIACNDVFTELVGFTEKEIENTFLHEKLMMSDDEHSTVTNLQQLFLGAVANEDGIFASAKIANQSHYTLPVKLHCFYDGNDTFRLYLRVLDNKSVDPISGLPNGWALTSRIEYLLNHQNITLKNMVLIILSVDNFSTINYRYNYDVGDQYLVLLGKTLQKYAKDFGFVVRFSNAKYAILVEDSNALPAAELFEYINQICQKLCQLLTTPIQISTELEISKSFSIGVSSLGTAYDCYHSMQIAAETAMHEAKKYSISNYCIATSQPTEDLLTRKLIIDEFPRAIEQKQIKIHYQPQYALNGGLLIGFEALSRWRHHELGNIPPDVFIAIAEDIGLHFEFDLWVFTQVCSQLVSWHEKKILAPRIAINISFKTMEMSTFIDRIKTIIKQTNCPTALLELEVTETSSINNTEMLYANVLKVKELGINIAIDDFGSGYSSLSLVRAFHMSLDKLKLDRSLIDKICNTPLDRNFAKHIIDLGKILNVKVLAEGVETQEQFDLLIKLGCDYAQGYYFAKALAREDAELLICNGL